MEAKKTTGYSYIKEQVSKSLFKAGFSLYKKTTPYRITGTGLLQFISFQKGVNSLSNKMTINIVQKGLFTPGCSFDTLQPGNRIGAFKDAGRDLWWTCDDATKMEEGVSEIKEIFSQQVLPFFAFSESIQNIEELVFDDKYSFLWWMPGTFVDKGFFLLKAGLYSEAIQHWERHQPSKVSKFKTIKSLILQGEYSKVDDILIENISVARKKLGI